MRIVEADKLYRWLMQVVIDLRKFHRLRIGRLFVFDSLCCEGDFDLSPNAFGTPDIDLAVHTLGSDDAVDDCQAEASAGL